MRRGPYTEADGIALADAAVSRASHAVARLVSLIEDTRVQSASAQDAAIARLEESAAVRGHQCSVIGVTGTPGSGKSSTLASATQAMLRADADVTVAVVAVDPSSPLTGGALLGDRTRMRTAHDEIRLYFRSQASVTALGGLAPSSFLVCQVLATIFDVVLVETVGIGQSEADITHLADRVYLVMAPGGGDDVQLLKAGIIEMPDAFIINKADTPAALPTFHQLKSSLWLARPDDADLVDVFLASARRGDGIVDIAESFLAQPRGVSRVGQRAPYFFERWVRDEFGRRGVALLRERGGDLVANVGGFGAAQSAFEQLVVDGVS